MKILSVCRQRIKSKGKGLSHINFKGLSKQQKQENAWHMQLVSQMNVSKFGCDGKLKACSTCFSCNGRMFKTMC